MSPQFPEWQRLTILTVAGFIVAFSMFSIWSAASNWSSLPANPIVLGYFFIVLIVVPMLAVWAFAFAWQERNPGMAAILAAIPAVILLLRAYFIGGI